MSIFNINFYKNFKQSFNVSNADKLKYGEIYTPATLINAILDLFDPSAFRDKNKKWLDPGAGQGYFFIYLFKRLDEGLAAFFLTNEERWKHIIENMLYMVELKPENVLVLRATFGEKANIISGDFLLRSDNSTSFPSLQLMDYVVGNPPYNANGIKKVPTNTKIKKKEEDGQTVWISFIKKSIDMLKAKGQLAMIIPSIWMKPDKARTYHYLTNYKLEKIHCLSNTETNKIFQGQAQTPTCYFLLTKTEHMGTEHMGIGTQHMGTNNKEISLFDTDKKLYISYLLRDEQPIPLFGSAIINKLMPFVLKYGCIAVQKTNLPSKKSLFNEEASPLYPYKNIKTCVLSDGDGLTPKLLYNYSKGAQAFYGVKKLVLAHKMFGFPFLDAEGSFGISNRDNYVILSDKNEILLRLKAFLSTKLVLYIYEATRYRMKYLEKYAFQFLPNISLIPDFPEIINDHSIAAYFGLDAIDVSDINSLHKKTYNSF